MKLKIALGFILLLFAFSCKKETGSDALTGKWRTTEILFTGNMSGGPLYIQFTWPDKVQSTFFSKCTGYSTSGDKLTLKNTGAAVSQLNYTYTVRHDTLNLYPSDGPTTANSTGVDLTFVKE